VGQRIGNQGPETLANRSGGAQVRAARQHVQRPLAGQRPTAGQRGVHKLEYDPPKERRADQPATIELSWSSASIAKSPIPPDRLFSASGQSGGLTGMYYATATLTGPAALQTDPHIRFDWGQTLPTILHPLPRPLPLVPRAFTVLLTFAEPDGLLPGQRVFSVRMQGAEVLRDFDVAREAGAVNRGVVKEFRGVKIHEALELEFATATENPAILCGVELIEELADSQTTR